jgi:hypothetical protein
MEQNPNTSLFSLSLDAQNSYTLRSAASWSKVLGIVGLILGIFFAIVGVMVQQALSSGSRTYESGGFSASTIGNAGLVAYVLMALIMIITSIFALNAGNKIIRALGTNDQQALSSGFANIRNYFAFWAIMIIIILLFMLLSIMSGLGG